MNAQGQFVSSKTTVIGGSEDGATLAHREATAHDALGRPTTIEYFPGATPGNAKWTTSTTYNCCRAISETDRNGIITSWTHDALGRQLTSTRLGVTTETDYEGLSISTHRYTAGGAASATNEIARQVHDLTGEVTETWARSPEDGTMVKTSIATTYKPSSTESRLVVTTPPEVDDDGGGAAVTHSERFYIDDSPYKSYGDLAPGTRTYYGSTATGATSTNYEFVLTTPATGGGSGSAPTISQLDWLNRTVSVHRGSAVTTSPATEYTYYKTADNTASNARAGKVKSVKDSDGVTTFFDYDNEGMRVLSVVDLNANGSLDPATDRYILSETGPADRAGVTVWRSTLTVFPPGVTYPAGGIVVSQTDRSPDGLETWTTEYPAGADLETHTETDLGTAGDGDWTVTSVNPDGTWIRETFVDGLLDKMELFDAATPTANLIASTEYRTATGGAGSGYDAINRPTHRKDSRTGVSITSYYNLYVDAVTKVEDPGGRETLFSYDHRGRRVEVDAEDTGAVTNVTTTKYFPDGRVKEVDGDNTYRRSYTYDKGGRMETMSTYSTTTATITATTTWNYDPTHLWLNSKRDDDNKGADYTYTDAGRLETRTWARGKHTRYAYDDAGALDTVSYFTDATETTSDPDTADIDYDRDRLGRLDSVDQGGVTTHDYVYTDTAAGGLRLDKELFPAGQLAGRQLDRGYDTLLRPSGIDLGTAADPDADHEVGYNYHADTGRIQSVSHIPSGANKLFTYAYEDDSAGLVKSVTGPHVTKENHWETDRDLLDKVRHERNNDSTLVAEFDYSHDVLGRRTSVARAGYAARSGADSHYYNATGELVSTDDSAAQANNRAYQYDGIGNRDWHSDGHLALGGIPGAMPPAGGTSTSYTSNSVNEYTAVGAQTAPAHDDDGNLTFDGHPGSSNGYTITWDGENRMVKIEYKHTDGLPNILRYEYDYRGRLVKEHLNYNTTFDNYAVHAYDGWNRVATYLDDSGLTRESTYTWGLDLSGTFQGAGGVGGLLAVDLHTTTGTFQQRGLPVADGNGNIVAYLDDNAASAAPGTAKFEHDPFGVLINTANDNFTNNTSYRWRFRFSSKAKDFYASTPYYHYGYRNYSPATGRWASRDPIGERGGFNLYGFVTNDGVNWVDPLGLEFYLGRNSRITHNPDGSVTYDLYVRHRTSKWDVPIRHHVETVKDPSRVTPEFIRCRVDQEFHQLKIDEAGRHERKLDDIMVVVDAGRAILPGADGGARAGEGDFSGAALSIGTDLAGGKIIKLAAGALGGAFKSLKFWGKGTKKCAPNGISTQVDAGKFDYLFGRGSGRAHNVARTNQNALQMQRLGIPDTAEGHALLRSHLDDVVQNPANISRTFSNKHGAFEVRESLCPGPSGKFSKFESTWQVMDDGTRRLTTIIPFGG